MLRTEKDLLAQEAQIEHIGISDDVQDLIPVTSIYENGIFRHGTNLYSICIAFSDVNYRVANEKTKENIFTKYMHLINTFDSKAVTKITLNNKKLNLDDFKENTCAKPKDDGLNKYRDESNRILLDNIASSNAIIQERYITVTIRKGSLEEAKLYFDRLLTDLQQKLVEMGSSADALDAKRRLQIFYDFFHEGNESAYTAYDLRSHIRKGHSFKDYICPDSIELIDPKTLKIGNRYARCLVLKEYANFIKDTFLQDLTEINKSMMISLDIISIPTDEAVKEVQSLSLGVETNGAKWQRKQNESGNWSADLPMDIKQQKAELDEFLNDITTRDQKMLLVNVTLVHTADSLEELRKDTESLIDLGNKNSCQLCIATLEQVEALQTALPWGVKRINNLRTLTSEATAVFMPYKVQDIIHKNGVFYGQNVISKNLILLDKTLLKNANSWILGVPGAGKSFTAKNELISYILRTDGDIIIIDPEREYRGLVKAMGGEVIYLSATSKSHINALDINADYAKLDEGDHADPVILKSQFIMSLFEQVLKGRTLGAVESSIIDRCTKLVYKDFIAGGYKGNPPTLRDMHDILMKQEEPEAHELALSIELFTEGSLNTFSQYTNIDISNRVLCFDLLDLGNQLLPVGHLVMLDYILNRLTRNRAQKRQTYIFIDEISLLFKQQYSAIFLKELWQRARKYGGFCTGITQNAETLLNNSLASTMLSNSEAIIMLSQAATDRIKLAKLLNISEDQLGYVTNAKPGSGLIRVGESIVPFVNNFPKDTELYTLITTKLGESDDFSTEQN